MKTNGQIGKNRARGGISLGATFFLLLIFVFSTFAARAEFTIPDTGQVACFNNFEEITCPEEGEDFYGQDAQYEGHQPGFTDNGDGTVTDNNTNLMWQQTTDANGDGVIDVDDKMTHEVAQTYCQDLVLADQTDWGLPTITELYSLIDFSGRDVSATDEVTDDLDPFIDTHFFDYAYGDTSAGERVIDSQYASETLYVADPNMQFGVNFADGRIKGYWLSSPGGEKTFYVQCVRGDTGYGENDFVDNGDSTVTDQATGLMWSQGDSEKGLNWQEALAWVAQKNKDSFLDYSDWRLPNAKELQSIVDYTRSPDISSSAAIAPVFTSTEITNEAGQVDYGYYWASTTHKTDNGRGEIGVYICFGRALGFFNGVWTDVHGAGAQRCEFKDGDPDDYPEGHGPQGDAVRILNFVRLVRDVQASNDGGDDGDNGGDDSSSEEGDDGGGGGCFIGSVFWDRNRSLRR